MDGDGIFAGSSEAKHLKQSRKQQRILICPLDWGIGHATRCVPIIRSFLDQGDEVLIAADGRPLAFLEREFPALTFIRFPGYHIRYPKGSYMAWKMLLQGPSLLNGIRKEHKQLQKIVQDHQVDLVISDNRFGLWSRHLPSIFITHQLDIQIPNYLRPFSGILQSLNYLIINKYQECWIPDFPNHHGLAGRLSHPEKLPQKARYIGTLSRFDPKKRPELPASFPDFELLVLLSGPEPQRSILEEKLITMVRKTDIKTIMVRGMTESMETTQPADNLWVFDHLESDQLQACMERALIIICRSGYSSLMDITTLGKRAILIPTPGQTEQEYLAKYLMNKKIFFSMPQESFDLLYALELSINYPGMVLRNEDRSLPSVDDRRIRG
jgi:uncharacterized protein (TIGR00661 family)